LAHSEHHSAHAHAATDVLVNRIWSFFGVHWLSAPRLEAAPWTV
jgi:hypothetical protein